MHLGISSWSYPWAVGVPNYPPPARPLGIKGLIEKAQSFKVGVVQIADNLPLDKLPAAELGAARELSEKTGVVLEGGTRGIDPDHLLRYLDCCLAIGAKLLRTLTHTATSKPNIKESEKILAQVLPRFEKAGVVIGIENNESHTLDEYVSLMKALPSPSLGMTVDTANSHGGLFRTEEVINALAPYAVCLHYKDFTIGRVDHRMGFHIRGTAAGQGKVNGPWVIQQVASVSKKVGKNPNVILELWPPYTGDIDSAIAQEEEWVRQSIAFLRTLVPPDGEARLARAS